MEGQKLKNEITGRKSVKDEGRLVGAKRWTIIKGRRPASS